MMCFLGCGKHTVTEAKVIKQEIPQDLLSLEKLEKPEVKSDLDIINAYSILFLHYKQCQMKLKKIKALQEN